MKLSEAEAVHDVIDEKAPDSKNERFIGMVEDKTMGDSIRVTIIATGIGDQQAAAAETRLQAAGGGGPAPTLEVVRSEVKDECFVSGRVRKQQEDLQKKYGGDTSKIPAILRRQRN